MTDQFKSYINFHKFVDHGSVNHSKQYVDGIIHTNTVENFWSLLKRGIVGQYHKVSVKHLPMYINEFTYRYNNRKNENIFDDTILRAVGGRQ